MVDLPRFVHSCPQCVFLGTFNEYDLYYCPQGGDGRLPTVVARYGNEDWHYKSGLDEATGLPELYEAKRRAVVRGLLRKTDEGKWIGYSLRPVR